MNLIEVDCGDHGDLLVKGHVDRAEFAAAVAQHQGDEPGLLEMVQHGFVRILPGGRFGTSDEFDTFYQPCPEGGRGAARVTAFCSSDVCRYARVTP